MALAGNANPRTRTLLYPLLLLGGIALTVFLGFYLIDWAVVKPGVNPIRLLLDFDVDTLQNALGNMAQVVAAILGIVITVVSIVVQLAATRYTSRIADLFFRDRTNLGVLGFFVVACINAVWCSIAVAHNFLPKVSVVFTMILVTASLLIMVPYFAYVFDFLDPDRVVGRIQQQAVASALDRSRFAGTLDQRQQRALVGVEQLSDIAINAASQKDKAIASGAVDAIKDLAVAYLAEKRAVHAEWFTVGERIRANPDFVSLAKESIDDIAQKHIWLEYKVLRQYQSIYNEALGEMPDVNHLIAINTRYIAEAAMTSKDNEAIELAVKFFNTYLRATLNSQRWNVRTAYIVLNQYRQLAERMLDVGLTARVGEIAFFFKYYAQIAHSMELGFITETAAYDLATLCERAYALHAPSHGAILKVLLEVDKEAESQTQEHTLRGVRKAQAKLASFYLVAHDKTGEGAEFARQIFDDMKDERPERLRSICDELLRIESKDFWEVIDRGTNFDYVDDARKAQLKVFFSWFPSLKKEAAHA
ncbi:MAG TPA: DUF2254 family protein [Polyangia bacterium]|nr:DUF2254 family protein [Polyangia bacterium]